MTMPHHKRWHGSPIQHEHPSPVLAQEKRVCKSRMTRCISLNWTSKLTDTLARSCSRSVLMTSRARPELEPMTTP